MEEGEDESKRKDIEPHHVARLYGIIMARMLSGDPSIVNMYDSRSWFNHCAPAVESMPRDCLQDLYRLLHFVDDWELDEDKEWDDIYDHPKEEVKEGTASHRTKHGLFEDAYVKRWQQCVKFGKWMTADESRAAGWYHSCCTIGSEPKPIRTGCTLHTLCVTYGDLASYKLYTRIYGGKHDADLSTTCHKNCVTDQKWVHLYDMMLTSFKGNGHCVTCDSAYMGDTMAQVSRNEWKVNMVGTIQSNRTSADIKPTCDKMKLRTYETAVWQHKTKPLYVAAWADNAVFKTLSNFHSSKVIIEGIRRCGLDADGKRMKDPAPVNCPEQMVAYCETFHLIDKGNGVESRYTLANGGSKTHTWTPKLSFRLFNMTLNNAYKI